MYHHHLEPASVEMANEALIVFADGVFKQKFGKESDTDALSSFCGWPPALHMWGSVCQFRHAFTKQSAK